jgi:hypothetical protein
MNKRFIPVAALAFALGGVFTPSPSFAQGEEVIWTSEGDQFGKTIRPFQPVVQPIDPEAMWSSPDFVDRRLSSPSHRVHG